MSHEIINFLDETWKEFETATNAKELVKISKYLNDSINPLLTAVVDEINREYPTMYSLRNKSPSCIR